MIDNLSHRIVKTKDIFESTTGWIYSVRESFSDKGYANLEVGIGETPKQTQKIIEDRKKYWENRLASEDSNN